MSRRPVCHGGDQLAAEREDVLRIAEHDLPDIREREVPTRAREQLLAERRLERANLGAHGGLCQAQLLSRPADTAFTRGKPEVEQMMVVEPLHAWGESIGSDDEWGANYLFDGCDGNCLSGGSEV